MKKKKKDNRKRGRERQMEEKKVRVRLVSVHQPPNVVEQLNTLTMFI